MTQDKQIVTKDMLIGDVIARYPDAASIMLGYGLHCVGCSANPFDTIESGCMVHGMDEGMVENLVNDINEAIAKSGEKKAVSITSKAASKFMEFMKDEGKPINGIRLGVAENNGIIQYSLDFAETKSDSENAFEDNGINVFVEREVADVVKGIQIDYVENENGSGFKINNPNPKIGGCCSGYDCAE